MSEFKRHRMPINLNLVPLVDVFSMLVIFLVLGTVVGGGDLSFEESFSPPKSFSAELSESAPTLLVTREKVEAIFAKSSLGLSVFMDPTQKGANARKLFQTQLSSWRATLPKETLDRGAPMNVAAHENLSYQELFEVLKVVRAAGFETLMFVALAETGSAQ